MNKLQNETSPYLLQHKDNPVDWYPWSEEAIKKAVSEDKPIFLSIGYSACHWCHVMEKESFENEKIAQFMNEYFVNIKVDREERPDIDNIYMNFVQMTTGSGGWPLNVFLSPELIPFFGGTYFPPEDKFGKPGFLKLLKTLSEAYRKQKMEIIAQKNDVVIALSNIGNLPKNKTDFTLNDFNNAFIKISESFDKKWGGFGDAPKFPNTMTHMFLLRYYKKTGSNEALEMVKNSLIKMAKGGIYDQIGGGFHRYSTDANWLIPHFEKMLYDNALLSRIYLETYQVTNDEYFLKVAEHIFTYVLRDLVDMDGGFYSSQDADSDGEEGRYFVWKVDELNNFLNTEELNIACKYFGVTESGNFDSSNILTSLLSEGQISQLLDLSNEDINNKISEIREKMLLERNKRNKPNLDDKVLVSWNGLMIVSLALGYGITGNENYLESAVNSANFVWEKCFNGSLLYHTSKNGEFKIDGYLDDYSFMIEAFISLYEVSFVENWLNRAETLADIMIAKFYDSGNNDFYYSSSECTDLIIRVKDLYDNAIPGGNSSAINALLKLSKYLNNSDYYNIAYESLHHMHDYIIKYPMNFSYFLCTGFSYFVKPKEIVVIVKNDDELKIQRKRFFKHFLPFTVLCMKNANKDSGLELLKDKIIINDTTTFYICQNYTCKAPISSFEDVIAELNRQ